MSSYTTKRYNPTKQYFIADPSFWPILGSIGLFTMLIGLVQTLHDSDVGPYLMVMGVGVLLATTGGWFSTVIKESIGGLHSHQMDKTYRWGMFWFIVSELFLFGIFFGALFYTRMFTIPALSNTVGDLAQLLHLYNGPNTHNMLWPNFSGGWPLLTNPDNQLFPGPKSVIYTWEVPLLNTVLLLSSAMTVTWAHWALKKDFRGQLMFGLLVTIILGFTFEYFQMTEYYEAIMEMGLTLNSGIYGSTFFILTGLHALHVTIGAIMLTVILVRVLRGHFLPEHHFAFEAVSWYWHMVDVVWIILFVFVYWL